LTNENIVSIFVAEEVLMKLVIVESPTKSESIGSYLGPEYKVVASKGNIRDLATNRGEKGYGINIKDGFEGIYVIDENKKKIVSDLKKLSKQADEVIIASDPDREGEAIAWHLAIVLDLPVETVKRALFQVINKETIIESFNNLTTINLNLVESQESRRMLDRIVGFGLSKFLQHRAFLNSAGRVQSAVLKIIVDKEREIHDFVPEEYWLLNVYINKDKNEYKLTFKNDAKGNKKIRNEAEIAELTRHLPSQLEVANIEKRTKTTEPQLAYTTATLQQDASNKYGFSSKRTMDVAQKLFEGVEINGHKEGLISYHRTDNPLLDDKFIFEASKVITEKYGRDYLRATQLRPKRNAMKKTQDGHTAIKPANLKCEPDKIKEFLTPDQYKLYKLIYERAFAAIMKAAKSEVTTITLVGNGNVFTMTDEEVIYKGYRIVMSDLDNKEKVKMPHFDLGERVEIAKVDTEQKFTEPPARFSEGRIIKEMDEKGIGRPSTYASTLQRLFVSQYIVRDNGLKPTQRGIKAIEILEKYFPRITQVDYTANLEEELDEISSGNITKQEFLSSFYKEFSKRLDEVYELTKNEPLDEPCPNCGGHLVNATGRYGPYIRCLSPGCGYTSKVDYLTEEPELLDETCPECGSQLVKRQSRYGKFIACSNYPTCKYKRAIPKKYKYRKTKKASE
jgi:DNA topoisomerase-1